MQSEPPDQVDGNEERATAFVFGELSRDEAMEFMKAMDGSAELRATVAAIREAVGAVKAEFETTAVGVNRADRQRIEAAIRHPNPEPPPVVAIGSDRSTRQWVMGLAVAATLLLACGLTLPALNRIITANSINQDVRERIRQVELDNQRLREEKQALVAELAALESGSETFHDTESTQQIADATLAESEWQRPGAKVEASDLLAEADRIHSGQQDALVPDVATSATNPKPFIEQEDSLAIGGPRRMQTPASVSPSDAAAGHTVGESDVRPQLNALASDGVPDALPVVIDSEIVAEDFARQSVLGQWIPGRQRRVINPAGDPDPAVMEMGMAGIARGGEKMRHAARRSTETRLTEFERALEQSLPLGLDTAAGMPFIPVVDNPFLATATAPISLFESDSDADSYTKLRTRVLTHGQLPSPAAVRIEDLINAFQYGYALPTDDQTFAANLQIAQCPWNTDHRLARIGIQGKVIKRQRPASNLVFLLDVSGSMNRPNKLPLVMEQLKSLVQGLDRNDSIAIVAYASAGGLVLDATAGDRKKVIHDAIDRVRSGGPTSAGRGIQLAYWIAGNHYLEGGTNRVIVCSDGDFNFGATTTDELLQLAEQNAERNIFLSVLGFGADHRNDPVIEQIHQQGSGSYTYVESEDQARQAIVDQLHGSPATIAKDVQIQVEFNPIEVDAYRLIGYENWSQDMVDMQEDPLQPGDIAEGQSITALYEIVPHRVSDSTATETQESLMGPLKYQRQTASSELSGSGEMLSLKLNYKEPSEDRRVLVEFSVTDTEANFESVDRDFQFAASVAAFGMMLRNSPYRGVMDFDLIESLASAGAADDRSGYREEFLAIVQQARKIGGW